MKNLLLVLILSHCIFAADRDTVPLKKKTTPAKSDSEGSIVGKPWIGVRKQKDPGAEAAPGEAQPYIASLSVYGTSRLNEVTLRKFLGKELDEWIAKGLKGDDTSVQLEDKLAEKLKTKYGFAEASWSVVQFFEPDDLGIHITLDVVEKADAAKRLNFLPEPKGEFPDPDGLIAAWAEYEGTALKLVESGTLTPQTEKCVALHCPFGHKHEKLKKFEKIFVDGVKKNVDALANILQNDKRGEYRAAAGYLLPYFSDGNRVVSLMVSRVRDPDPLVRNNVLRVLGDIAEFSPQYVIPVKPVVTALDFPKASDRAKAVYVVYLMALNSQSARDEIRKTAGPELLQLLAGKQPDSRDFSHGILRKISGRDYPATDVAAWTVWYQKLSKDRGVSGKK
jgi:hypothetical protein